MQMRIAILIGLAALAAGGCQSASDRPRAGPLPADPHPATRPVVRVRPASTALAFTPPAAPAEDLALDRDGRGPYAYAGYETQIYSSTTVYQDDDQRFEQAGRTGDYSRFRRRAFSSSVTVRTR